MRCRDAVLNCAHFFSFDKWLNMVNPQAYPQYDGAVWGGRVNRAGDNVQYTITMLLENNVHMTFDPFITATNRAR
jgi:hypothetical protein